MKKKHIQLIIIVSVIAALYFLIKGKEISYTKATLNKKNPTSFIFEKDIKSLRYTIIASKEDIDKELGVTYIHTPYLHYLGVELFLEDSVLNKPENKYDLIYGNYWEGYWLYTSDEGRVSYSAAFHLHLDSLGHNETRISVNTINPTIFVNVKSIISHAPGAYNYYTVEPTTIEEYKIIRTIGKKLNIIQTMPELILPERGKNITAKEDISSDQRVK